MPRLELRKVGVRYGRIVGTDDISLVLEPGQAVALVGSNGAGKSSTLKAIMGLATYPIGDILLDGDSIKEVRTSDIVRAGIGYSPEGRRVFTGMTVLENLKVGAFSRASGKFVADVERIFGYFPRLKERSSQRAGSLSGGEQQMLAIGRALMSRPSIFLLDEPSLGLAPAVVERIGDVLKEIQRTEQLSVLLCEQNVAWALSIADSAIVVELGRIAMTGAARDIAQDPRVQRTYLGI
jgi:branched-chain amino acid transport system ATP-binding protein